MILLIYKLGNKVPGIHKECCTIVELKKMKLQLYIYIFLYSF